MLFMVLGGGVRKACASLGNIFLHGEGNSSRATDKGKTQNSLLAAVPAKQTRNDQKRGHY